MGSRSPPAAECGATSDGLSQDGETFRRGEREGEDDIKEIGDKEEISCAATEATLGAESTRKSS